MVFFFHPISELSSNNQGPSILSLLQLGENLHPTNEKQVEAKSPHHPRFTYVKFNLCNTGLGRGMRSAGDLLLSGRYWSP
jgi:hypothetical protein